MASLNKLRDRNLKRMASRLINEGFHLAETQRACDGSEYVFLVPSNRSRILRLESPENEDEEVKFVSITEDDFRIFQEHCKTNTGMK